jgi:hypothetical protein
MGVVDGDALSENAPVPMLARPFTPNNLPTVGSTFTGSDTQLGLWQHLRTPSAATFGARSRIEVRRANALVNAWARTGSCDDVRIAGDCGVIAAVSPGVLGPTTVVTAAAGGGLASPSAIFDQSTLFEIASNTKVSMWR